MDSYLLHPERLHDRFMKLLANENFPLKSVLYLRNKGFDILSIGQEIPGIQDDIVLAIANEQERIILTFDRDYGELIFKNNLKVNKGVIYLRLRNYTADEPGILLEQLLNNREFVFDNALTVLDKNSIRQRKY